MPLLSELPKTKSPKSELWPWESETPLPKDASRKEYPKISVVTPSYGQGRFIEETIRSVLLQNYPNLEYIVMDGGSKDETVEVLKKYDRWIDYWVSEPDKGQSDAINKGFRRATGDIICWLNSDDYYTPNTLFTVAHHLDPSKKEIFFGECLHINDNTGHSFPSLAFERHQKFDLKLIDYMIQPSSFWTKRTWDEVGELSPDLHYIFDWDWFIRAQESGTRFIPSRSTFSVYRIHEDHKSGQGGGKRLDEIRKIYEMYAQGQYPELFDYIRSNRKQIDALMHKLVGVRLSRFYLQALYVKFPDLYKKYRRMKLEDMIAMG